MLHLLLNADDNGVVEFSDRGMSRVTGISYQKVRTIHYKLIAGGIITNAQNNACVNAKPNRVIVSNSDCYSIINNNSNAFDNAVVNAGKEQEIQRENDKVSPLNPLQTEKDKIKEQEDIPPCVPPEMELGEVLSRMEEMQKAFYELSEENKKLQDELKSLKNKKNSPFIPPSEQEVADYIRERGYHFDAGAFVSFYMSNGWLVGKNKMKDWKAACRTWESKRKEGKSSNEDEGQSSRKMSRLEKFVEWVEKYYPTIRDMEMPNEEQLEEMIKVSDGNFQGCIDDLQDDYHTGSLYDLFIERFGGNR